MHHEKEFFIFTNILSAGRTGHLSMIDESYEIDPIEDMKPVCPIVMQ
ncbi:MAG: hypothetical protein ACLR3E_01070 [Enterococcus durans]